MRHRQRGWEKEKITLSDGSIFPLPTTLPLLPFAFQNLFEDFNIQTSYKYLLPFFQDTHQPVFSWPHSACVVSRESYSYPSRWDCCSVKVYKLTQASTHSSTKTSVRKFSLQRGPIACLHPTFVAVPGCTELYGAETQA